MSSNFIGGIFAGLYTHNACLVCKSINWKNKADNKPIPVRYGKIFAKLCQTILVDESEKTGHKNCSVEQAIYGTNQSCMSKPDVTNLTSLGLLAGHTRLLKSLNVKGNEYVSTI